MCNTLNQWFCLQIELTAHWLIKAVCHYITSMYLHLALKPLLYKSWQHKQTFKSHQHHSSCLRRAMRCGRGDKLVFSTPASPYRPHNSSSLTFILMPFKIITYQSLSFSWAATRHRPSHLSLEVEKLRGMGWKLEPPRKPSWKKKKKKKKEEKRGNQS